MRTGYGNNNNYTHYPGYLGNTYVRDLLGTYPMPLRFNYYAWQKILYFRDRGGTEIGGFGVCSAKNDFLITDFAVVEQTTGVAHVDFEDEAVADYFDDMVDAGLKPAKFARVWIHTHPGNSADPSPLDETTFSDVFGSTSWSIMFILAKGGEAYARLQNKNGKGLLNVEIDKGQRFRAISKRVIDSWEEEYKEKINKHSNVIISSIRIGKKTSVADDVEAIEEEEEVEFVTGYSGRVLARYHDESYYDIVFKHKRGIKPHEWKSYRHDKYYYRAEQSLEEAKLKHKHVRMDLYNGNNNSWYFDIKRSLWEMDDASLELMDHSLA